MTRQATGRRPASGKSRKSAKPGKPGKRPSSRRKAARKITVKPLHVGAVLLFTALLISVPYLRKSLRESGAAIPQSTLAGSFAIDISHYQDSPSWDSLLVLVDARGRSTRDLTRARQVRPVEYAFIKATEGESMVDERFALNWEAAGNSRVRRGAYHFYRSSRDPLKQAQNFIATVGPLTARDLPPVLDVETMHKGCTKASLNEGVRTCLAALEEHYGRKPIIYASEKWLQEVIAPDITASYPVWVAHYGVDSPLRDDWVLWQFTSKAVVHGVPGKIDLNCIREGSAL